MSEQTDALAQLLYEMNGSPLYGRSLGDWNDPTSDIGDNPYERDRWARQARLVRELLDNPTTAECACLPCPGRGNDGHGLTHCAECCFGTSVEADIDCPIHGTEYGVFGSQDIADALGGQGPTTAEGERLPDYCDPMCAAAGGGCCRTPPLAPDLDAVRAQAKAEALRDMADEVDRGPSFAIPPSIVSALIRERADQHAPTTGEGQ